MPPNSMSHNELECNRYEHHEKVFIGNDLIFKIGIRNQDPEDNEKN